MKQKKTFAIGIDLGATTVKGGVVDAKGKLLTQFAIESMGHKGPIAVQRQIATCIRELLQTQDASQCKGIGIGAPGVVRVSDGTVHHPPNFANWTEVPLAAAIRKVFPFPVFIENDANSAALAEARFGVGSEYKDFLFVIWGTGVGGGVILDRKIYRGPFGGAGEIGHVSIDYNGRQCNCGNLGCIEAYIGQRYLSLRTKEIIQHQPAGHPPSAIVDLVDGDLQKIEPAIIAKAAEAGDQIATEVLREAGELLGCALASAMNILDLRVAVIGGGISAAPRFVFSAVEESVKARVLKPHRGGIKILRASLGNPAGIIGAASLVM
jgi:glucokinase